MSPRPVHPCVKKVKEICILWVLVSSCGLGKEEYYYKGLKRFFFYFDTRGFVEMKIRNKSLIIPYMGFHSFHYDSRVSYVEV